MTPAEHKDPLTRAAEASEFAAQAFRDLHEASKDLVDLEIVIPSTYRTREQQDAIDRASKGPSLHLLKIPEPPIVLLRQETGDDIDQALADLLRDPWYKRLWNWVAIPFQAAKVSQEHEEQVKAYKSAGVWGSPK